MMKINENEYARNIADAIGMTDEERARVERLCALVDTMSAEEKQWIVSRLYFHGLMAADSLAMAEHVLINMYCSNQSDPIESLCELRNQYKEWREPFATAQKIGVAPFFNIHAECSAFHLGAGISWTVGFRVFLAVGPLAFEFGLRPVYFSQRRV